MLLLGELGEQLGQLGEQLGQLGEQLGQLGEGRSQNDRSRPKRPWIDQSKNLVGWKFFLDWRPFLPPFWERPFWHVTGVASFSKPWLTDIAYDSGWKLNRSGPTSGTSLTNNNADNVSILVPFLLAFAVTCTCGFTWLNSRSSSAVLTGLIVACNGLNWSLSHWLGLQQKN